MHGKTIPEMREITLEAERRVRAGEPRAHVAQALGIPLATLAGWAHRGGWRRKDLVAVRNVERGQMILGLIDEVTAAEREKQQADAAKMREALEASKAELEAFAPGGRLPGAHLPGAPLYSAMGEGPVPPQKLAMAMADSLLRQGQLEEADRAIRLAVRFAEAEQAAGAREEVKWREERERTIKVWAEKQGAYHKLHAAAEFALGQIQASDKLEANRSAEDCCPKCGRRMDFWPEEVERPDDDDSGVGDSDDSRGNDSGVADSGDSGVADSGDSGAGADGSCHPHWKKDAKGSYYWDGPPGE